MDDIWLVCFASIRISLKDGLGKNELFQDVEEMILRFYYIYKKSPKKLRQLKSLYDMFEENGDFTRNGYRPKNASGCFLTFMLRIEMNRLFEIITPVDTIGAQ